MLNSSQFKSDTALKDSHKLALIVLVGVIARVFSLWIGRAEFAGWFNHTYYYFVQTRGLIEAGALPYADMPFLFYFYSAIAKGLIAIGIEQNSSIVASTRLIMCIVPSLIPVAVYGIVKRAYHPDQLKSDQWLLVLIAGFLPLSLIHLPELLQKNMLGLLLMYALVFYSLNIFNKPKLKDFAILASIVLLIVFSHFGTTGAMLLYGIASFIAYLILNKFSRTVILAGLTLVFGITLSVVSVYFFDLQRFNRIFSYLSDSVSNSVIYYAYSDGDGQVESIVSLGIIAFLFVLMFFLYQKHFHRNFNLPDADRLFLLANIIFACLLLFPLLDLFLMARFAYFLSIPLIVVFAYAGKYVFERSWVKKWSYIVVTAGVLLVGVGEIVRQKIRNTRSEKILAELEALNAGHNFHANDLFISTYGAEHLCNWFFEVKATLITSLNVSDFNKYNRVIVLNPIEGSLNFTGLEGKTVNKAADKFFFMRRNIPRPIDLRPIYKSEDIELFELKSPPSEWMFDSTGTWIGYGKTIMPMSE